LDNSVREHDQIFPCFSASRSIAAGIGGTRSGLAYQLLQAGLQLKIPRLFAALFLITATGIVLFLVVSWLSGLALRRWHESELPQER
jgi:NitT/TauT family transport system permease protein